LEKNSERKYWQVFPSRLPSKTADNDKTEILETRMLGQTAIYRNLPKLLDK
jgi:hypothetical protein